MESNKVLVVSLFGLICTGVDHVNRLLIFSQRKLSLGNFFLSRPFFSHKANFSHLDQQTNSQAVYPYAVELRHSLYNDSHQYCVGFSVVLSF